VQLGELRTILTRLTKGVELRIALDADSARVHMDRSQFDQVMLNLVVNACDACDAGGRIAVSSTVRYETPMGVLASRMAATRTTDAAPYEAWICIGVEDTGGDVVVESTPGGGTRFESWLPLASASAALMAAAATPIS
jgi:signal transduction histidine kinase